MPTWQRRQILIWGKTRPELSLTYKEIVCTGGVFRDTGKLVRLYPIPLRFMDNERLFAKYQWIEADVARNPRDPRPESFKIRYGDIKVLGKVKTRPGGDWSGRASLLLQPQNVFQSVEALQQRQRQDGTSLGIVKPKEVLSVRAKFIPPREQALLMERWEECSRQGELALEGESIREIEPLAAPQYWFLIRFTCEDPRCTGHEFKNLDWEVDAYYHRRRKDHGDNEDQAADEVVRHLTAICGPDRDLRFFVGNIANHPGVFTLVGLWHPKRQRQSLLFG